MTSEKQRMLRGERHHPDDPELTGERYRARDLLRQLNAINAGAGDHRRAVARELFGTVGDDFWIEPPFFCDYGWNIHLGHGVFLNFNCVILDSAPVVIGSHAFIGPGVQIYTPVHPMDHRERRSGHETAAPVSIGDDIWIGGGAIILPGVTIGDRTVIGSGAVVTRDVPADVFAAGNPCRIIRELGDA